jgi:serine/threonine-protein kinase
MPAPDPVMELLLRWDELRLQGREVSAEELCRDCPEHADELRRRIAAVCAVDRLMLDETRGEGEDTATTSPPREWPSVEGYEILGELGRGGVGVVYRARQRSLNRVVALKMLLAGAYAGEYDLARFRREAETLAQMQHPGIVQIHELGEAAGHPYLALEYVEGGSLAARLAHGPPPPEEAARWVAVAARAVAAAHQRGIVHRDLKPGNVLLAADGTPKVSDFGLAKQIEVGTAHTPTGAILGTPPYMAPEQASGRGGAVSFAADVYALGVILYEALTGRPPFRGKDHLDTLRLVVSAEPVRPSRVRPGVPRALEKVCLKCLEKRPERRYRSAVALADDLERWLRQEPVRLGEEGRLRRLWWAVERHRRKLVAAAMLLLALVGGFLLLPRLAPPDTGPGAAPAKKEREDPDKALREIAQELTQRKTVTLIGEKDPPRWSRWELNGGGSTERPTNDGAFAVSSVGTSLLTLVPDPRWVAYRFSAEVRHDFNPNDGEVGLFFGFQDLARPGELTKATYYTLRFSDRGANARIVPRPNEEAFSNVIWHFRYFERRPFGSPLSSDVLGVKRFTPALPIGEPGPWRKLLVEVTGEAVRAKWGAAPDGPLQLVRERTVPNLNKELAVVQRGCPGLQGRPLRFAPRTALGLFVFNSTASFRRVILEALED